MNDTRRKLIRIVILLLWMALIFYMSQKDGNNSTNQSNFVADMLRNLGFDIKGIFGDTGTFIIRKFGHLSEYFILTILFFRVFILDYKVSKTRILSIICTFIYASSDEVHQLFIIGRTGSFRDVLIDTFGGIIAIVLIYCISNIRGKSQIQ